MPSVSGNGGAFPIARSKVLALRECRTRTSHARGARSHPVGPASSTCAARAMDQNPEPYREMDTRRSTRP